MAISTDNLTLFKFKQNAFPCVSGVDKPRNIEFLDFYPQKRDKSGGPGGTRIRNLKIRNLALCPVELRSHVKVERLTGLEPAYLRPRKPAFIPVELQAHN